MSCHTVFDFSVPDFPTENFERTRKVPNRSVLRCQSCVDEKCCVCVCVDSLMFDVSWCDNARCVLVLCVDVLMFDGVWCTAT